MNAVLPVAALFCAAAPAVLFCVNLRLYRPPQTAPQETMQPISVLVPARDEERSIAAALSSILASSGVEFEVIVLDDASTDSTASIVAEFARLDPRVRLLTAAPLPPGWNGKQHACWILAQAARHDLFCFVDADVRLAPSALRDMFAFLCAGGNELVSGFPRQVTGTWLEWMLLPLIHFVLLGFLPLASMRSGTEPAKAAGCGQFLMMRREAYLRCGGHSAIRATMHDGLLLPRLFRAAGYRTDLADLTPLASCRMYTSAAEVWRGLAKNATEGLAAPSRIVPISALLLMGQVVPFLLLFYLDRQPRWERGCVLLAVAAAWLPRILAVRRFRQDWRGALLHPFGILLLLAIQWYALGRKLLGGSVSWKTRAYAE